VTERQVVASLALQWATPVLAFPAEALPENTVLWELWKALRIMPVRLAPTKHVLYVAFSDPVDHSLLRAIEHMTGWSTSACVVSDQAMNRLLSKVRPPDKDSTHTFENVAEPAEMARIVVSYARETECHRGETHRNGGLTFGCGCTPIARTPILYSGSVAAPSQHASIKRCTCNRACSALVETYA
jgi:hypothetical protein